LLPKEGLPSGDLGCVNVTDRRLLTEILLRPGEFYLNAHNEMHPGGALRGQLVRVLG
jgi:hypothetical protein